MGSCNSVDDLSLSSNESSSICLCEPKRTTHNKPSEIEDIRPREVMIKHVWDAVDGYRTEVVTIGESKNRHSVRSSARINVNSVITNKNARLKQKQTYKNRSESSSYYYSDTDTYSDTVSYSSESSSHSSDYIKVKDNIVPVAQEQK